MLENVKLALRITGDAFNTEISALIADCIAELQMLGVYETALADDSQILSIVIFYCKAFFGDPDESERWQKIYKDKLEKLQIATGYGNREE